MSTTVRLDLAAARRWALTARAGLADARERINALNVFPVPDGDTGTNMFLTMDGALEVLRGHHEAGSSPVTLQQGLGLIARGMLLSARGNSGVILSQLSRGLHEAVSAAGDQVEEVSARLLAEAFERADALAWQGVTTPVEGTILSVSRAAAQGAAGAAARAAAQAHDVAEAALSAAGEALQRTPEQLPVLARAGVVDAGGAGYVLLIEALEKVLSGRLGELAEGTRTGWLDRATEALPGGGPGLELPADCEHGGDGAFEVMYLLTGSDAERAQHLRAHLAHVGSSVLVVGGPQEWRVHVHLDEPRVAVEAGAMAGHLEQVSITDLPGGGNSRQDSQDRPRGAHDQQQGAPARPVTGVVACAPGDGLVAMFIAVGAEVVRSAPGARASTGELLSAIWAVEADAVVVLPNDQDTVLAAQAAARAAADEGVQVAVVPSVSVVQGLSAMAVWSAEDTLETNVSAMTEVAAATRHGSVTAASKDADTPVGPCRTGQALGLVGSRIVVVADSMAEAIAAVLAELVEQDTEILTVVHGAQADPDLIAPVLAEVTARHTDLEVVPVEGGQRTYPWLFGAE